MKATMRSEGVARKILGAGFILALLVLGIPRDEFWKGATGTTGRIFITALLIVCFLGFVVETVLTVLNDIEEKSGKNHYKISKKARKERAYHEIHILWREGKTIETANPERHQEWDKRVIQALADYCGEAALQRYLINTGRAKSGGINQPIDENYYSKAVSKLDEMVDEDLRYSLD